MHALFPYTPLITLVVRGYLLLNLDFGFVDSFIDKC